LTVNRKLSFALCVSTIVGGLGAELWSRITGSTTSGIGTYVYVVVIFIWIFLPVAVVVGFITKAIVGPGPVTPPKLRRRNLLAILVLVVEFAAAGFFVMWLLAIAVTYAALLGRPDTRTTTPVTQP
jgi:hypothetical protein